MNIFYLSVFLMCYSYYESCVTLLSKNMNTKVTIKAICESKKISLSEDSLIAMDYLQNDMKNLRNNICHNYFGTYCKASVLKRLSEQNVDFDYDENILLFTDSKFILDALDRMHMVLSELCIKLNYKTMFI